jgi:hypothetical protein
MGVFVAVLVGAGVSVGTCVAVNVGFLVKAGGATVGTGCDAVQALSHVVKTPKRARNILFLTCDLTCRRIQTENRSLPGLPLGIVTGYAH